MYIHEISIEVKSIINVNEIIDEFGLLMSFYRGNGQTQGNIESQYIENNKIYCLPYTLEKKSLDIIYNNIYINNQIEKIQNLCNSSLKFKIAGKSYKNYSTPCSCKKRDFYILYTDYLTIESPLRCGNCYKSIPLYHIPIYEDYGYIPILSWETNYKSCDNLQMNCEVGERWSINQMQKTDSQLSKQGLGICKKIEKITSIPTYYYLYNYNKISSDCPSCNKKWSLEKKSNNFYDYKCDHCKIVSTITTKT
ncbi:DUF2310 family Zn-ribbon-containing protein [Chishuiella sp.]|uniref:DUF2310 family Zn-ribbon-containing protein n=1 Tax=Chishuiella sp. TaxID=1969467 RepID=UPI0028A9A06B|nr:DUF2310 family Zn-ribbon-containing protein [Chishuiella sp.]